ncbi:MAG: N-acetylneuraminic acid synthase [Proteobacteria bacterium]|nr:MAG: N-acetylneuraminic acid synthase [Pseudomonadota bacterium]
MESRSVQVETATGKALPTASVAPQRWAQSARGVRFVAEVSSNHGADLARSLAFVEQAAAVGFDAVKFQLFRVRELFAPEVLARSAAHRAREAWELPDAFVAPLAARAHALGIGFGCTPFHLGALDVLRPHCDFLKIASYELLWHDLLAACAATGLPVVLSTGMATAVEVAHATRRLLDAGCADLTLLHCVSAYPTPPEHANLAAIEALRALAPARQGAQVRVGWSDHSADPAVVLRAVHRFGARFVEMHFDLDGAGAEFPPGHCWLPAPASDVIRMARAGIAADGDGEKRPAPEEWEERAWRADPSDGLRPLLATRKDLGP